MRKIVAGLFMSLDGVVESPADWAYRYFADEMSKEIEDGVAQADAILLGRRTYQEFVTIWPRQGDTSPMAAFLNNTPKHVVSSTLDRLEWGPAELVTGSLVERLTELKRAPGANIQVPGSPTLVRWLLGAGLLDELHLSICPVVIGSGSRLFDGLSGPIDLERTRLTGHTGGAIGVSYRPA